MKSTRGTGVSLKPLLRGEEIESGTPDDEILFRTQAKLSARDDPRHGHGGLLSDHRTAM